MCVQCVGFAYLIAEMIMLSSDSLDDNKGQSIASVPKEGPSIQGLLDWYGYDTVEEYLEETFFPSTDKDTTDKDITDEDTIHESYSPKSKGKYVPVSQKYNLKVIFKSPIPITGCVLGLENDHIWDDILKKFGVRKPESYVDKKKGKIKLPLQQAFALQIAFALQVTFTLAFAASICLESCICFATSICSLPLQQAFALHVVFALLQAFAACLCSKHLPCRHSFKKRA
ncbi:hypothetical protein Tco_1351662 [Tanacetum coccineum]